MMKKFYSVCLGCLLIFSTIISACSKSEENKDKDSDSTTQVINANDAPQQSAQKDEINPVEKYVVIMQKSTEMVEAVKTKEELENINGKLNNLGLSVLVKNYANYPLNYEDKQKIKEVTKKFLEVLMSKTIQLTVTEESEKKEMENEVPTLLKASDQLIDQATTLGMLN